MRSERISSGRSGTVELVLASDPFVDFGAALDAVLWFRGGIGKKARNLIARAISHLATLAAQRDMLADLELVLFHCVS
jgi:hypothetical protein